MFSKTEKKLNEINNFNPPPGYYATEAAQESKNYSAVGPNFPRQDRFSYNKESNPGPGAYYNDRTDKIRKSTSAPMQESSMIAKRERA